MIKIFNCGNWKKFGRNVEEPQFRKKIYHHTSPKSTKMRRYLKYVQCKTSCQALC